MFSKNKNFHHFNEIFIPCSMGHIALLNCWVDMMDQNIRLSCFGCSIWNSKDMCHWQIHLRFYSHNSFTQLFIFVNDTTLKPWYHMVPRWRWIAKWSNLLIMYWMVVRILHMFMMTSKRPLYIGTTVNLALKRSIWFCT